MITLALPIDHYRGDEPVTATYEDKINHIELVADHGVEARRRMDELGEKPTRRRCRKVFEALSARRSLDEGGGVLVFADTPTDRPPAVMNTPERISAAWARHVRRVFVASCRAGEPRPSLPKS